MSKESYIGGDYIETTGGDAKTFAGKSIVNSSAQQFAQKGETSGVSYSVNTAPPSLGNLDLIKIKINTTFDVCHDEVSSFSEFKSFWILEDKGKYYHWLSLRGNPEDKNKPDPLPVTLASTDSFVFTATFKTKAPVACKIRVQDSNKRYVFKEQQHPKKNKDEEHELTFTCDTKPYKDTVQYLENFTLNFEYSEDGKNWAPMKSVKFCLYLTIGNPGYDQLSPSSARGGEYTAEDGNRRIINRANGKESILETFLYVGCKFGKGSRNADEIMNNVFAHIKTLNVERARIKGAMGYWRNTSSLHASSMRFRGVRYLIKYGEARCGEWSSFLQDICKIQSGSLFTGKFDDFVILPTGTVDAGGYKNSLFLVKEWTIKDPLAPVDIKQKAQDLKNIPLNLFWDHVFTKYGNTYFDPSYGLSSTVKFADDDALLKDYASKALSGILYAKTDPANPFTDAIAYKPQAGKYLDPFKDYTLTTDRQNRYKYKTVISDMQKELIKQIYPN